MGPEALTADPFRWVCASGQNADLRTTDEQQPVSFDG